MAASRRDVLRSSSGDLPKVLLVEDDPDRVHLTEHAVETSSTCCELETAQTGAEALAAIEDPPETGFDLVLLDLDLPDLPGHEVCREIRAELARGEIPIVVLTSSDEEQDVRNSYRVGANSHVTKAVDYQSFRDDLEGILTYWLGVNRTLSPGST